MILGEIGFSFGDAFGNAFGMAIFGWLLLLAAAFFVPESARSKRNASKANGIASDARPRSLRALVERITPSRSLWTYPVEGGWLVMVIAAFIAGGAIPGGQRAIDAPAWDAWCALYALPWLLGFGVVIFMRCWNNWAETEKLEGELRTRDKAIDAQGRITDDLRQSVEALEKQLKQQVDKELP